MTDTPRTAAGRALLEGMLRFAPDESPAIAQVREGLRRDIRAIEAEAAALTHEHDPDKCDECQEMVMEALRD